MEVKETGARWKSVHEGKTYYFCAPGCKAQFDKNPRKFMQ
jgi:YHS domain-containing protein